MNRLLLGASALLAGMAVQSANAQEYVYLCDRYGVGFFYIPGTEQCYKPDTGEIRYETEDGTVFTETAFAARVRELEAQSAISIALEDPDLVAGERFGIKLNWGATETADAIGLTGAILLGDSLAAGGTRMIGTGGLGFAEGGYVGARFGLQVNW
jgi:hypothetical protein